MFSLIFAPPPSRPPRLRAVEPAEGWWRRLARKFIDWLFEPIDFPGRRY